MPTATVLMSAPYTTNVVTFEALGLVFVDHLNIGIMCTTVSTTT